MLETSERHAHFVVADVDRGVRMGAVRTERERVFRSARTAQRDDRSRGTAADAEAAYRAWKKLIPAGQLPPGKKD